MIVPGRQTLRTSFPLRRGIQVGVALYAVFSAGLGHGADSDCASSALGSDVRLVHADGRPSSLTLWMPEQTGTFPYIVFSHGAYSSPGAYERLLRSWAGAGYVVAAPLHADSERLTGGERLPHELTWRTRREDVALLLSRPPAMVEELRAAGIRLAEGGTVIAGHSYGAFTAQVFGGATARPTAGAAARSETSEDVVAVIAFSPPGPLPGFIEADAWDTLTVPQLVVTGTADVLPGFIDDWRLHRMAHDRAPGSDRWLLVADDADHYFGNLIGRLEREVAAQQAQFAIATEAAIDFLRMYLPTAAGRGCTVPGAGLAAVYLFEQR